MPDGQARSASEDRSTGVGASPLGVRDRPHRLGWLAATRRSVNTQYRSWGTISRPPPLGWSMNGWVQVVPLVGVSPCRAGRVRPWQVT
jgi:hypothetical protein